MDEFSKSLKWDDLIGYKQNKQKEWTREEIILKWRNLIKTGVDIYKITGFMDPVIFAFCRNKASILLPIPDLGLNDEAVNLLMKDTLTESGALAIFMSCQGQFVKTDKCDSFKAVLFFGQLRSHHKIETFLSLAKINNSKLEEPSELMADDSASGLLCDFLQPIGPPIKDFNTLRR
jgi:hypothetical protein